jgi:hypothetical protein
MVKRIFYSLLWAATFFAASASLSILGFMLYSAMAGTPKQQSNERTSVLVGLTLVGSPFVIAVVAAGLSFCGRLPGTKRET